jgi:hypothetical protein
MQAISFRVYAVQIRSIPPFIKKKTERGTSEEDPREKRGGQKGVRPSNWEGK